MYSCDPVLILLFIVLVVMLALIVRELAVNAGYLEGPKLFDGGNDMAVAGGMMGGCDGYGGKYDGNFDGGDCLACGGDDFSIFGAMEK